MECTLTSFCVTKTLQVKICCGVSVGDQVNMILSPDGIAKVSDSLSDPCNTCKVTVQAKIEIISLVSCLYKYSLRYDPVVLKDMDNPLVSSDILLLGCR